MSGWTSFQFDHSDDQSKPKHKVDDFSQLSTGKQVLRTVRQALRESHQFKAPAPSKSPSKKRPSSPSHSSESFEEKPKSRTPKPEKCSVCPDFTIPDSSESEHPHPRATHTSVGPSTAYPPPLLNSIDPKLVKDILKGLIPSEVYRNNLDQDDQKLSNSWDDSNLDSDESSSDHSDSKDKTSQGKYQIHSREWLISFGKDSSIVQPNTKLPIVSDQH